MTMQPLEITDLDRKEIEVEDLALALLQAGDYRHYRVSNPNPMQLHLQEYWEDCYQKLLQLDNDNKRP